MASDLVDVGNTSVRSPPPSKGAVGGIDGGYTVYDMNDVAEFDQKHVASRWLWEG